MSFHHRPLMSFNLSPSTLLRTAVCGTVYREKSQRSGPGTASSVCIGYLNMFQSKLLHCVLKKPEVIFAFL